MISLIYVVLMGDRVSQNRVQIEVQIKLFFYCQGFDANKLNAECYF